MIAKLTHCSLDKFVGLWQTLLLLMGFKNQQTSLGGLTL